MAIRAETSDAPLLGGDGSVSVGSAADGADDHQENDSRRSDAAGDGAFQRVSAVPDLQRAHRVGTVGLLPARSPHASDVDGAQSFLTSGDAYFRFMGRYSQPLAPGVRERRGGGAGAARARRRVRAGSADDGAGRTARRRAPYSACDPSPPFVAACAARNPGVEVTQGRAEELPYEADTFDVVLAQLVMHFVSDPRRLSSEMTRVVRPGGRVAVCVWDFERGMEMLRAFWDAAVALDPEAPGRASGDALRAGRRAAGAARRGRPRRRHRGGAHRHSAYADFDELWNGFLAGIGPAGSYLVGLPELRAGTVARRSCTRGSAPRRRLHAGSRGPRGRGNPVACRSGSTQAVGAGPRAQPFGRDNPSQRLCASLEGLCGRLEAP